MIIITIESYNNYTIEAKFDFLTKWKNQQNLMKITHMMF